MVGKTQIIRHGEDICLIFSDELRKKYNIEVGDDVDTSYSKEKGELVIKLLK